MALDNSLGLASTDALRIFSIGVTGHREGNASYDANSEQIREAFERLLDAIAERLAALEGKVPPDLRLVTNLAHGADLMAAESALDRGYRVLAPLPFGNGINLSLNTPRLSLAETAAMARGEEPEGDWQKAHLERHISVLDRAQCFELADQDALLHHRLERLNEDPDNKSAQQDFENLVAKRSKAASQITVEQSDVVIAIWDGMAASAQGGTRDTMASALAAEIPVIWLDAREPSRLHWLDDLGDLAIAGEREATSSLEEVLHQVEQCAVVDWTALDDAREEFQRNAWRSRSAKRFHAYRRTETMFSGEGRRFRSITQYYEPPEKIAEGSAKPMLDGLKALPGSDPGFAERVKEMLLPRFAFADGISTYLSDAYRGGMVASFALSAMAIIGGVAYLPLVGPEWKWPFALLELVLLLTIVMITISGSRGKWHNRWFRTRRVAEYLRAAPITIAIGCERPKGYWPASRDERWPELYARQVILSTGLPHVKVTQDYLKQHLSQLMKPYLISQRDYHRGKARRLAKVHHDLDHLSEALFVLAIVSVGIYLALVAGAALGIVDYSIPKGISKIMTFFGVAFPTLGAAIAGIRYFGDFERFAAISDVSAERLDRLIRRADLLLEGTEEEVSFSDYVALAHAMNDVVIEEIESWQSIFGTKKMSVPV